MDRRVSGERSVTCVSKPILERFELFVSLNEEEYANTQKEEPTELYLWA